MPEIINPIMQDLKNRPLDWLLRLVTLVVLGLATYITIRLVPIYQRLDSIDFRVSAIEKRSEENKPLIERFIILEQKVDNLIVLHDKMDTKLDLLLSR